MTDGDPRPAATPEDPRRVLQALSHDLRGVLTPIGLWVHLALDAETSEAERMVHLRKIEGLVKRMEAFVSNIPGVPPPA